MKPLPYGVDLQVRTSTSPPFAAAPEFPCRASAVEKASGPEGGNLQPCFVRGPAYFTLRHTSARGDGMALGSSRAGHGAVVDTSRSQNCRLRPASLTAVRLEDEFWAPRLRINRGVTL